MGVNKCVALVALILVIYVVPSQEQSPKKNSGIPLAGLLNPGLFLKVIEGLREMAGGLAGSDYLLVGMKCLEIFRNLLRAVNLPILNELNGLLDLIHGCLETLHPLLTGLKQNAKLIEAEEIANGNGLMFQELRSDPNTTPAGILSGGLRMISALPKALSQFG